MICGRRLQGYFCLQLNWVDCGRASAFIGIGGGSLARPLKKKHRGGKLGCIQSSDPGCRDECSAYPSELRCSHQKCKIHTNNIHTALSPDVPDTGLTVATGVMGDHLCENQAYLSQIRLRAAMVMVANVTPTSQP